MHFSNSDRRFGEADVPVAVRDVRGGVPDVSGAVRDVPGRPRDVGSAIPDVPRPNPAVRLGAGDAQVKLSDLRRGDRGLKGHPSP